MQTSATRAAATSSALATALPAMTLRALADAYMAAYEGRDRTRPATLGFWCERFGERAFVSLTDDDVVAGLDALRARPARFYAGRDANGAPIHRVKGRLTASTVNRYHAACE